MKNLGIWIALLALLPFARPLRAVTPPGDLDLRLLTYNIHRDIGGSDSNVSSQPALAKVVNFLAPDIWTINELGGNNVAFNPAAAHAYLVSFVQQNLTIFGPSPVENVNFFIYLSTIDDNYDTTAIVSRYPIASSFTYSDAGNNFEKLRGLSRASITFSNGVALDVFTTHLKALDATANAEKRQTEADIDRNNIANWIALHRSHAIMVTGDWNETEDAGERTNWSGHHIGDILPAAPIEPYQPITTMRSAGLLDPSPASIRGSHDTIDSTSPDSRFDYTMYANGIFENGQVFDTKQYTAAQLAALSAANGATFLAADSASASDHLPVLATIRIGYTPEILSFTRAPASLSVTYTITNSASVTYTVEQSTDLINWSPASTTDQTLSQTADSTTIQSTVTPNSPPKLCLRVRATVMP